MFALVYVFHPWQLAKDHRMLSFDELALAIISDQAKRIRELETALHVVDCIAVGSAIADESTYLNRFVRIAKCVELTTSDNKEAFYQERRRKLSRQVEADLRGKIDDAVQAIHSGYEGSGSQGY